MASTLVYYAQKDNTGFPIPGTMMSVPSGNAIPTNSISIDTYLFPVSEEVANRVYHPEGVRYFVRVNKQGLVIPNTLISGTRAPKGLVREFKLGTSISPS